MIARDEEPRIARAIASVGAIAGEIIVVDTGSQDATPARAAACGAIVHRFFWADDFSAARNEALRHATCEYVLMLDADEVIASRDVARLSDLPSNPKIALQIIHRHYVNDERVAGFIHNRGEYADEEHGIGHFDTRLVRVFPRRADIYFEGAVHELVEPSIIRLPEIHIISSELVVHHYGHLDKDRRASRNELYTRIGARKLADTASAKANFELGVQQIANGNLAVAENYLRSAAALTPNDPVTLTNLGYVLCELGKLGDAHAVLTHAVFLAPESRDAKLNLGLTYLRAKSAAEALSQFELVLKSSPDDRLAIHNLGLALLMLGRKVEAARAFRRLLFVAPDHVEGSVDLAELLLETGELAEAEQLLGRFSQCVDLPPRYHFFLAEVLKGLGRRQEAVPHYREFCRLAEGAAVSEEERAFVRRVAAMAEGLGGMKD